MTRTRPTMTHYRMAKDLAWLEAHWGMIDQEINGTWTVYASEDHYDHEIHATVETLEEAVAVARGLVSDSGG